MTSASIHNVLILAYEGIRARYLELQLPAFEKNVIVLKLRLALGRCPAGTLEAEKAIRNWLDVYSNMRLTEQNQEITMDRKALECVLLFAYEGMRKKWSGYPDWIASHEKCPFSQGLLSKIRSTVAASVLETDDEMCSAAKNWCAIYREWLCAP
jgi:hypothetical protein